MTGEGTSVRALADAAAARAVPAVRPGPRPASTISRPTSLGDGEGDHARATTAWLTGVHGKRTEGDDVRAGVSIGSDRRAGSSAKHTPLPVARARRSRRTSQRSAPATPATRASTRTRSAGRPDDAAADGDASARRVRAAVRRGGRRRPSSCAQRQFQRSMLDSVIEEMAALQKRARRRRPPHGRPSTSTRIRDVEQRIQRAESHGVTSRSTACLSARSTSRRPTTSTPS